MTAVSFFSSVQAHPPVSLVMDSNGRVFFSDLANVWMIDQEGAKSIVVTGVHTHELWIDSNDNLYGEDVRNVGENYRHRIWKRTPEGLVSDSLPWRQGHPTDYYDYSFSRDGSGNSFVANRDLRYIDVRTGSRSLRHISLENRANAPSWLAVRDDGSCYIVLETEIWYAPAGKSAASLLAADLIERTDAFDFVGDHHAIMGIWPGNADDLYVAVFSGQVVKRIDASGKINDVIRMEGKWSPVGGMIGRDGVLWLLEWSSANEVRVRRFGKDGRIQEW